MNARTVMSERGQVVIPKDVRDALGLERGQTFSVETVGGDVVLRPVKLRDGGSMAEALARLRSIVHYTGPVRDEGDWQKGIERAVRAKWGDKRR